MQKKLFKESTFSNQKDNLLICAAYFVLSLILVKPITITGILITTITITPLLLIAMYLLYKFDQRFRGSKLLTGMMLVFIFSILVIFDSLVMPMLEPYIGEHFA